MADSDTLNIQTVDEKKYISFHRQEDGSVAVALLKVKGGHNYAGECSIPAHRLLMVADFLTRSANARDQAKAPAP